jgi:hypothetical protein
VEANEKTGVTVTMVRMRCGWQCSFIFWPSTGVVLLNRRAFNSIHSLQCRRAATGSSSNLQPLLSKIYKGTHIKLLTATLLCNKAELWNCDGDQSQQG